MAVPGLRAGSWWWSEAIRRSDDQMIRRSDDQKIEMPWGVNFAQRLVIRVCRRVHFVRPGGGLGVGEC
jgi:hypothetical protein